MRMRTIVVNRDLFLTREQSAKSRIHHEPLYKFFPEKERYDHLKLWEMHVFSRWIRLIRFLFPLNAYYIYCTRNLLHGHKLNKIWEKRITSDDFADLGMKVQNHKSNKKRAEKLLGFLQHNILPLFFLEHLIEEEPVEPQVLCQLRVEGGGQEVEPFLPSLLHRAGLLLPQVLHGGQHPRLWPAVGDAGGADEHARVERGRRGGGYGDVLLEALSLAAEEVATGGHVEAAELEIAKKKNNLKMFDVWELDRLAPLKFFKTVPSAALPSFAGPPCRRGI